MQIMAPTYCMTGAHHRQREVCAGHGTKRNHAPVPIPVNLYTFRVCLADEASQSISRLRTAWLIAFWCIDPKETNAFGVGFEGIAVDDADLCLRLCRREEE